MTLLFRQIGLTPCLVCALPLTNINQPKTGHTRQQARGECHPALVCKLRGTAGERVVSTNLQQQRLFQPNNNASMHVHTLLPSCACTMCRACLHERLSLWQLLQAQQPLPQLAEQEHTCTRTTRRCQLPLQQLKQSVNNPQ